MIAALYNMRTVRDFYSTYKVLFTNFHIAQSSPRLV
jgi:hypothetical protein